MPQKAWLYLAIGVEVFHWIFIVGVLICGGLWLPAWLMQLAVTVTVMGQVIFLWCPLSVFSNYCLRKYDPYVAPIPGLTFYLYRRFGRVVGIPIFLVLISVSILIGMARF